MIRRGLSVLTATVGAALVAGVLVPVAAQAATRPQGGIAGATQDKVDHSVTVSGWAYDPRSPRTSITVRFYVGGKYAGQTTADHASPTLDRQRHLTGRHNYVVTFARTARITTVVAASRGIATSGNVTAFGRQAVTQVAGSAGARIVAIAKTFVGHARYVDGGTSPRTGFDCSGYTQYVYAAAHVASLARTAQAQRTMSRMHRVPAGAARPGDLVFYQDGGYTYHVAIYAGNHMQYAAATPRDGIRYQAVWSSAVLYGHYS